MTATEHQNAQLREQNTILDAACARLESELEEAKKDAGRLKLAVDVFRMDDIEPFICAVRGKATVEDLTSLQADILERAEFTKGDGIYTFTASWFYGQYDTFGRCEWSPGWEFDEVGFAPHDSAPAIDAEMAKE